MFNKGDLTWYFGIGLLLEHQLDLVASDELPWGNEGRAKLSTHGLN